MCPEAQLSQDQTSCGAPEEDSSPRIKHPAEHLKHLFITASKIPLPSFFESMVKWVDTIKI
jgi:hypothetical protein